MKEAKKKSIFCPFKEAFELKTLGFDEPCLGYYLKVDGDNKLHLVKQDLVSQGYNYVLAPTFSQVFSFFREKYDYDVSIVKRTLKAYKFEIQKLVEDGSDYFFIDFSFDNFDEAEIECVKKLIRIVQWKK